jgi:hypothetical protein
VKSAVAAAVAVGAAAAYFASQAGASQVVAEKAVEVYTPASVHCFKLDYINGYDLRQIRTWYGEDGDDRVQDGVQYKSPGAGWKATAAGVQTSGPAVSFTTYNVTCKVAQQNPQAHVVRTGFWPNKANGQAHVWINTAHYHTAIHT